MLAVEHDRRCDLVPEIPGPPEDDSKTALALAMLGVLLIGAFCIMAKLLGTH
jgi:hypothetical protein